MKKIKELVNIRHQVLIEDWDALDILDGGEGSGKSNLGLHLLEEYYKLKNGKVTKEDIKHMCLDRKSFLTDLKDLNKRDLTIFDEAGDISSRQSMSKFNVMLMKTYQIIRGDNLWTVLILPRIFDMESYFRNHRLKGLFHVFRRGRVAYYDKKRVNELLARNQSFPIKNYNIVKPLWIDSFPQYKGMLLKPYLELKDEKMKLNRTELYNVMQEKIIDKKIVYPEAKCLKCDYEWRARSKDPRFCPECRGRKIKVLGTVQHET